LGSGLTGRSDVIRRGDVADLTRAGEPAKPRTTGGPRLDQPLENNSFAGFIRQRELRWDSLRSRLGAKFFWLQPGCRAALALCPRLGLRFCFVVPANADIAMYGSPRTCWFKPTGQGPAAAHLVSDVFRQRQCCLSNRCKLVSARRPFWLGRPDSSGRGFCAGFSRLSRKRWSVAGVGSNQHRG
jgi:hypothetical protein